MKKLVWSLTILFLVALLPLPVAAENPATTHVYDEANLLSDLHIEELETIAAEYGEKLHIDFIFFTREDESTFIGNYMDDFYDEKAPGYDKAHGRAVLVGVDMIGRDIVIDAHSDVKEHLDPDRLTMIRDKITSDLTNGNYIEAFTNVIYLTDKYMKFKPGVNPNNPIYKTSVQFVIALILGGVVVGAMLFRMNPRMTTNAGTYHDSNNSEILGKRDRYIRTTVTKRRKPKQNKGGGGSSGGSIGRTSGGFSRSRSSGKF